MCHIQGEIDTYDNMVSRDYDSRDKEDKKVHEMLKRARAYLEKQKEYPKEELVYRMNGLMQEYCEAGEDVQEKEHRLKCYQLFWDAMEDADFFEQKEEKQKECFADSSKTSASEDERILNGLIAAMKDQISCGGESYFGMPLKDILAYLEKQKEQIPYVDFIIKPHKGDDNNPYDMSVSEAQEYTMNRGFDIPWNDGDVYVDERHLTQTIGNIIRWADEHPKEGNQEEIDVLDEEERKFADSVDAFREACDDAYQRGYDAGKKANAIEWSEDDETRLKVIKEELERYIMFSEYRTPLSVDDIDWLKSLPERFNLQPKQEWGEEDETHRTFILESLEDQIRFCKKDAEGAHYVKQIRTAQNWLKSLPKEWKPSEEQMEALKNAAFGAVVNGDGPYLRQLYNELKKR